MVSFTLPWGKNLQYSLDRKPKGLHSDLDVAVKSQVLIPAGN
jgi:hypothetical protein